MHGIIEDLRFAIRALSRHRSFALVAALSLALGIGANTTIFTLLNAILLQPLPVKDPNGLAVLYTLDSRNAGIWNCSYPNYKDYRDRNDVFSSLLLFSPITVNLTGRGDPQRLMGQIVSGNYFATLGVAPVVGRGFLPEEDRTPGANPVAVISFGLWRRIFGADAQVTNRSISLNGREYRIVGVAPAGFVGLNGLYAADVWVPMMMYEQVHPLPKWVNQRRALLFSVIGRLKPGITLARAEAAMQGLSSQLEVEYPAENQGRKAKLSPAAEAAFDPKTRPTVSQAGVVLLIISGLVLLIACGNVANLLLARATGRSKEIAVRLAMGASRWRLVRQLLTESMLLAFLGGSLGLLLARWVGSALWSLRPPLFKYAGFQLNLDGRVLGYTLAVSVLTGLLFGLIPAFRSTSTDLAVDLKERSGQASFRPGSWNPRSFLVMVQVALSLVALVGAGLFVRSLSGANRVDPGFDAAHLGIVLFNIADSGYGERRGRDFQQRALELAAATPGVESAAIAKDAPFHVSGARTLILRGQDPGQGRLVLTNVTWPGFFRTTRTPLLRGRDFSPLDNETGPRVAIVNDAAAHLFWPGEDAIGHVVQFFGENLPVQVVGVARNANYQAIGELPQPMIYLSMVQYYFPTTVLYLHITGSPEAVAAAVRRRVQGLDRNLLLQSESLRTTIRETLWAQRLSAGLLGIFGGLALLLSTIGIYGVISYSVSQRVREVGIRMALGASARDVRVMILLEGIRLVTVGVVVGLIVSLAASRSIKDMLMVSPRDALTFVLVPGILSVVAALACWIPAVRATHIDPARALRDE